jgi:hypothetical protein
MGWCSLRENAECGVRNEECGMRNYNGGTMNRQQTLQSLSNVTKTYLRISQLKTILTVFFVGYTAIKVIKTIKR